MKFKLYYYHEYYKQWFHYATVPTFTALKAVKQMGRLGKKAKAVSL